jgi:rhodanese-related sulfurtransferase
MTTLAIVLACAALAFALVALTQAKAARAEIDDARSDGRRYARNMQEELERALAVQKRLLAKVVAGERITARMIEDGQLFVDLPQVEARALLEAGDVLLIDVRTSHEVAQGMLPGARHIPMDELEERLAEIPKRGMKIVYCAGGGRSASVCDRLAADGYEDVFNLDGGFSEWTGAVERRGS